MAAETPRRRSREQVRAIFARTRKAGARGVRVGRGVAGRALEAQRLRDSSRGRILASEARIRELRGRIRAEREEARAEFQGERARLEGEVIELENKIRGERRDLAVKLAGLAARQRGGE